MEALTLPLLAIVAGFVSFSSPCCLPLVPGYLSYVSALPVAELIAFHQRHRAIGDAEVLGVVYDDSPEAVRQFRADHGGEWPMLVDPGGRTALALGVAGVPESFLISPEGVVVSKVLGGVRAAISRICWPGPKAPRP